ncbi:MAG: hypothetical protein MUD14_26710 [Hydrococcus sp. Prado102]|jgi:hypothetical protein|nr:hypothetical protein [Hydrococcus sp. Prado102]
MTGFKYYVSKDQAKILKTESIRLGVDVADLIKMRLEQASTVQNLNDIQQILEKLAERLQRCELILMRFCELNEAELVDLGYLRGAIEAQASRSSDAVKRAEEMELRRLQMAHKIREEVGRYL